MNTLMTSTLTRWHHLMTWGWHDMPDGVCCMSNRYANIVIITIKLPNTKLTACYIYNLGVIKFWNISYLTIWHASKINPKVRNLNLHNYRRWRIVAIIWDECLVSNKISVKLEFIQQKWNLPNNLFINWTFHRKWNEML